MFYRILAPPIAPPPQTPQYLTILMTIGGGGRHHGCRIFLAPPMPPPPLPRRHNTYNYLNLKAPPLSFFALTHLILELHYCALGTFPKK